MKPSADDGQKKLEQGNALQTEDFSVPRICNVEYQGQINSYTVTVSTLSHAGDPATCTNDSVCKTCGMLLEEKWGHDLLAATCTEKAKCQRSGCSYTEPALGHDLSKATCTEPARCQREGCDYTAVSYTHLDVYKRQHTMLSTVNQEFLCGEEKAFTKKRFFFQKRT